MTSHHSVKLDQMGLQIDYSNPPSVRSGPKSGPGPAKDTCKHKMSIFDMMAKKRRLEAELKGLSGVLDSVCLLSLDGWRSLGTDFRRRTLAWSDDGHSVIDP